MPILLLVFGLVTWFVVGRALAPVEAIREEVDAISSSRLDRRVSDPPGHDEIARLATTMNRMLERLQDGQLRQRRFVSDASHELRSPVTTIRQHAELALAHPDTTEIGELAEVVLEEDVRLQALVEDLLLLTRIDEGTMELHTEPVDVDDLVFEEAARLRGATDLRIDISNVSAGRVIGDRLKLERLVRNLADNAARHASSAIRLAVQEDDEHVVLEVDDDGPGVPGALRGVVFERFTRLDESRDRDGGGTGLGLAIVAEIAGAHGGTASVSDAPLGGARFEVLLPRGAPDA
jgi:signal transduction histidine kinase